MKRIIPVASIVLTGLAAHSVYAEQPHGFIDYRHEYLDKKRTHADRVEFGTFFSNGIGLMGELRYNTQEGNKDKWDPSQFNNNGSGLSIVYRFKPLDDKNFWLEPMFWLDSTEYWTTYEYGLSAGYNFSKEWRVSGRFRYDMDKATSKSKGYGNDDRNNRRYDLWVDYRPGNSNFQYQLNLVYYTTVISHGIMVTKTIPPHLKSVTNLVHGYLTSVLPIIVVPIKPPMNVRAVIVWV